MKMIKKLSLVTILGNVMLMASVRAMNPSRRPYAQQEAKDYELIHAIKNKDIDRVSLLIQQKANPESRNKHGLTMLSYAINENYNDAVHILLKAKANPDIATTPGYYTPLHRAINRNNDESVRALLAAGADLNIPLPVKDTALVVARQFGYTKIVNIIEDEISLRNNIEKQLTIETKRARAATYLLKGPLPIKDLVTIFSQYSPYDATYTQEAIRIKRAQMTEEEAMRIRMAHMTAEDVRLGRVKEWQEYQNNKKKEAENQATCNGCCIQ